jgi:hypothetical protein
MEKDVNEQIQASGYIQLCNETLNIKTGETKVATGEFDSLGKPKYNITDKIYICIVLYIFLYIVCRSKEGVPPL